MPAPLEPRSQPGSTAVVRYWAAAKEAAGVAEEELPAGRLADVLDAARARHGARLGVVLDRCSFLVDGRQARPDTSVPPGAAVEVLPPFAGGAR